jgi:hypothetical protein
MRGPCDASNRFTFDFSLLSARTLSKLAVGSEPSDLVRRDGPTESLQVEIAHVNRIDRPLDRCEEAWADQGLTRRGACAEPGGEVRHRAKRCVVVATLEADPTQSRVTGRDADAKAELFWAIPEENYAAVLPAFFQFCRKYYETEGYRTNMLCVGYRVLKDQQSLLSYSWNGNMITIDPVSTANPGWQQFLPVYNQFCSDHGGVPLLNQTPFLSRALVEKALANRAGWPLNNHGCRGGRTDDRLCHGRCAQFRTRSACDCP